MAPHTQKGCSWSVQRGKGRLRWQEGSYAPTAGKKYPKKEEGGGTFPRPFKKRGEKAQ